MKPMESNPREKVLKIEGVDRISDLPDPILEKILSFLPTKNAVATSILSKRWKNLSPFAILPIQLDLDDSLLLHPEENESDNSPSVSFMDFVDKLLNVTLSNVHCVEYVNLSCQKDYGDAKIVSWVCAALPLKVEWLSLKLSLSESYTLFHCLHGCSTLVSLNLVLDSELCLPDNFSLPNLKLLRLRGLTLKDEDSDFFGELIEGCPALEDLTLTKCNLEELQFLNIESPRLKNLRIEECLDDLCEFILVAPNLEVLILNDHVALDYTMSGLESPVVAHINVGPSKKQEEYDDDNNYEDDGSWRFDNCVAALVTACSSTIVLYLAACSISALCRSSIQLPKFENLTCLSLGCICPDGWTLLARLLQNAPNLEKLKIDEGFVENEEGFANFQKSLQVSPACLELHMKIIEFGAFKGDENEIKLVEYFWKNGGVLQKIVLYWPPPDDTSILVRLQMLSRQSKTCQLECRWKERVHM